MLPHAAIGAICVGGFLGVVLVVALPIIIQEFRDQMEEEERRREAADGTRRAVAVGTRSPAMAQTVSAVESRGDVRRRKGYKTDARESFDAGKLRILESEPFVLEDSSDNASQELKEIKRSSSASYELEDDAGRARSRARHHDLSPTRVRSESNSSLESVDTEPLLSRSTTPTLAGSPSQVDWDFVELEKSRAEGWSAPSSNAGWEHVERSNIA